MHAREVRLSARGVDGTGVSYDSDVAYFEPGGRKVALECSRLAITQSSVAGSGALAGPNAVLNLLRAKENGRMHDAMKLELLQLLITMRAIPFSSLSLSPLVGVLARVRVRFSRKSSRLLKRTDAG